ncbi:MAG: HAD-IA family hydrolase [Firmicutes bacterium]|nr:HAD-IA family hydrolase [Bacillota bacterium]
MKKYILFDFDGTLVNTNDVILASWQHTYKHYLGHEVPVEHITACFGEPLLVTMEREFPGVDPAESAAVYRQFQVENADRLVTIFPGIKELLVALKEAGYVLGIVTSRTRESALRYMDMFGIASYFNDLVTCDDTTIHKPNPEPLLLALSKLGASADESLMIGDSPFDTKCANNAGVDSVMVEWRITCDDTSLIDDAKVDYWIHQPMELMELLAGL